MPSTETLDKLYLEWSQFTGARTAREIAAEKALADERDVIAAKARAWAENYSAGSDGRNTFVLFAEWVESRT